MTSCLMRQVCSLKGHGQLWTNWSRTNSFLQIRSICLNPPVNRRVIEREAALSHHFFEVTIAEGITQIPAYAEKDNFALVMTPFE